MGNAGPPGAFTQGEAFHAALRQHELGGGQQRGPEIAMMIIRRLRHRPHCSTGSAPSHDSPSLALLLWRHRPSTWSSAFWLSVLLGLVLTFVLGAGVVLSAGNGHWVGGFRTDATGVPILGWSRTGGDLRVAHFLGMHAMQALPLIGLTVERRAVQRHAALIVCVAALAYSAATLFVFLQALGGLPFIPA